MYFAWAGEMLIFFELWQNNSQPNSRFAMSLDFSKKSKSRACEYSISKKFNEPLKTQHY